MNNLTNQEKREILKKIAKGEVNLSELQKGSNEYDVTMWQEDDNPDYLRSFHADNNKKVRKQDLIDYCERYRGLGVRFVTLNLR
jgi:hypothetical protein